MNELLAFLSAWGDAWGSDLLMLFAIFIAALLWLSIYTLVRVNRKVRR